jgi:hypothetical protein
VEEEVEWDQLTGSSLDAQICLSLWFQRGSCMIWLHFEFHFSCSWHDVVEVGGNKLKGTEFVVGDMVWSPEFNTSLASAPSSPI